MGNNLWEQNSIGFNCEKCGLDEPFFMPVVRTDMMALRFIVPYYLVTANSNGLPVGANVKLSMVDQLGTTELCSLGNASGNKFFWSRYNDVSNKDAQYQFYFPVPFKDQYGYNYSHVYFDVNVGQHVKITGANTAADTEFVYGVDPTPPIFQEIKAGRLMFPYRMPGFMLLVYLDGVSSSYTYPYTGSTCSHENYNCFRVKLEINFTVSGVTKTYFTKPFKVTKCEDTLRITGQYPGGTKDCNGYMHNGTMSSPIADLNRLFLRIPADLTRDANKVKKTYNSKCFPIKSERIPMYNINSDPMPDWMVDEVENIMIAKDTQYDNIPLMLTDTDSIFSTQEISGFEYQYINLNLQSCKCLTIYSC